jgi:ABC-type branched-subunit amino acid transport system ATPase component
MQELALLYLRKALEEALKAGGSKLLDELFSGLNPKQVDALIGILTVVKARKQKTG